MSKLLLAVKLRRKRDLLEARQRARQITRVLGFDAGEQACIAAGVFALACDAFRDRADGTMYFQLKDRTLHISLGPRRALSEFCITKRLPAAPEFAEADARWMIRKLSRQRCPGVLDELVKLNQELLQALVEVKRRQPRARISPREKTA